jgi:hypothetical protein
MRQRIDVDPLAGRFVYPGNILRSKVPWVKENSIKPLFERIAQRLPLASYFLIDNKPPDARSITAPLVVYVKFASRWTSMLGDIDMIVT